MAIPRAVFTGRWDLLRMSLCGRRVGRFPADRGTCRAEAYVGSATSASRLNVGTCARRAYARLRHTQEALRQQRNSRRHKSHVLDVPLPSVGLRWVDGDTIDVIREFRGGDVVNLGTTCRRPVA